MNTDNIINRIKIKMQKLDNWRMANNSNHGDYISKRQEYLKLSSELESILTQTVNNNLIKKSL